MTAPVRLLALVGSVRAASLNRRLAALLPELVPAGAALATFDALPAIPRYDQDADGAVPPPAVQAWRDALWSADALIVVTPEYNYGIPGALKDAIDWASTARPTSALDGLPVGILGASPGTAGTARAQAQLREVLVVTRAAVLPHPDVLVPFAAQRLADGALLDDPLRTFVRAYLAELVDWARLVGVRRAARPR